MKLSTRLLLPLLSSVAVVMLLYGSWALRQRQASLTADAARETRAYALALGLAVERALERPEFGGVQEIIDRISEEPTVYGVLVYGPTGAILFRSGPVSTAATAPTAVLERARLSGDPVTFERVIEGEEVYSVMRPLHDDAGGIIGALEVAQPLTFVEAERARVGQRYLLNTLTLVVTVAVLLAWLVRRFIARPLQRFSASVRTFGEGKLTHRLDERAIGEELSAVARELNRMAEHLEEARGNLLRETDERIALERRLRESERLAAMGELAAGVAHEIAAPLQVIRGRADMVLGTSEREGGSRNLQIIRQQIDRITFIVQNLLGFARRREPRMTPLDLAEVVESVLEFLEEEIRRKDVDVVLEATQPAAIAGDDDQLHQVFLNLMINALHAVEASGDGPRRIHVRVRPAEDGATVLAEIRDTGPGIDPQARDRVFDPFFTTKGGTHGTGLGLSVARAIVQDHEGGIRVEANVPRGAVFTVSLPARHGGEAARSAHA